MHLAHRQACSLTGGPRGERNVPGASQLGLVYFPLLSIKHHFLLLIAQIEGVIKIQPQCDQTWSGHVFWRSPSSCRKALCAALLWEVMIMGIYETLLTSECKYNYQGEDNSHPHKQAQRKQTTISSTHRDCDLFTRQHKLDSKIGPTLFSICLQIQGMRIWIWYAIIFLTNSL